MTVPVKIGTMHSGQCARISVATNDTIDNRVGGEYCDIVVLADCDIDTLAAYLQLQYDHDIMVDRLCEDVRH